MVYRALQVAFVDMVSLSARCVMSHIFHCYFTLRVQSDTFCNRTCLSDSTSHPRGDHGWRSTARCKWLVETRYFSLGEQYYSTAGDNWTRMAKQLFRRSCYRNGVCSRSNGRISIRFGQTEAVICDSESLSSFQSNMGAGQIWFFMITDYLYVSHPSNVKISRLTLQNLIRSGLNLTETYSFSLV